MGRKQTPMRTVMKSLHFSLLAGRKNVSFCCEMRRKKGQSGAEIIVDEIPVVVPKAGRKQKRLLLNVTEKWLKWGWF